MKKLSKNEMKNVKGGDDLTHEPGDGAGCWCSSNADCATTACNSTGASCVSFNNRNVCVYWP